jgi:plastocyanin
MRRSAGFVALLALAAAGGGCGGGDGPAPAKSRPSVTPTGTESLEPGAVGIADFVFDPREAHIKTGATVTWVNTGRQPHTVKGTGFRSPTIKSGGTFEHRFAKAGRYAYVCTIHPRMTGTVVVR